jgi:hypothetical protein
LPNGYVLSERRLAILHVPYILPWLNGYELPPEERRYELAELVSSVLAKRRDAGLRLLLVTDDPTLPIHLGQHLTRPTEHLPVRILYPRYLEGVSTWTAMNAALRIACGGRNELEDRLREYASDRELFGDDGEPPRWALTLRKLRLASFIAREVIGYIPAVAGVLARGVRAIEADVAPLELGNMIDELAASRQVRVGVLGLDFGMHWMRGLAGRLTSLFGPLPGGQEVAMGFVDAWVEDRALLRAIPRQLYGGPEGDPAVTRACGADAARSSPTWASRVGALTSELDEAWRAWFSLIEELDRGGLLDALAIRLGMTFDPDPREVAAFLFAIETRTPEEIRHECFGRRQEGTAPASTIDAGFPHVTPIVARSTDLAERVAAQIGDLLGDETSSFLEHALPNGSGPVDLQLQEWLISTRWRGDIARELGDFLGVRGLIPLVRRAGRAIENRGAYELAEAIIKDLEIPERPAVSGARSGLKSRIESLVALLRDGEADVDAIYGQVVQLFTLCETATMATVFGYAEAFPEFGNHVREKLRKWKLPVEKDLAHLVVGLELGRLTALLDGLLKRVRTDGCWHAQFSERCALKLPTGDVIVRLEALRMRRPDWAHGGRPGKSPEEIRRAALLVAQEFQLLIEAGFGEFVPPVVVVVDMRRDQWGCHAGLIDEDGQAQNAYRVDVGQDFFGKQFYVVSGTNPIPVCPLLVPVLSSRRAE